MTLDAIMSMQLGQVVDFCIDYNKRHKEETQQAKKKENKKYRIASPDEMRAYYGR